MKAEKSSGVLPTCIVMLSTPKSAAISRASFCRMTIAGRMASNGRSRSSMTPNGAWASTKRAPVVSRSLRSTLATRGFFITSRMSMSVKTRLLSPFATNSAMM